MNKVRLIGMGVVISGILIGYLFSRTDVHLLSGMLIGLGIGWLITGKFISHPRARKHERTQSFPETEKSSSYLG